MLRTSIVLAALACAEPPAGSPLTAPDPELPPLGEPTTSPPPAPVDPCSPLDGLDVVSLVATGSLPDTLVTLEVTLTSAASVAGACISDTEPDQIFFAESTVASTAHSVRLSGLLPDQTYTCTAAPTCPTTIAPAASTTWETGSPPSKVYPFTVTVDPILGMTGAWTLAPHALGITPGMQGWIVIWGPDGTARWWMALPEGVRMTIEALYHPEDGAIVWGGGRSAEGRIRAHHIWDGELYGWEPEGWEDESFHHDAKRLDDGRLMTLEEHWHSANGNEWEGFEIRVHDPITGIVDFQLDSQAFVDQGILATPTTAFDRDPYHANWLDWHEHADGPRVYLSMCYAEQILAIDGVTGTLVWQLGEGMGWNVIDAAGEELSPNALPDCQHGLEVLGDDHLLVYDNGIDQASSFAQEWLIDGETMTAQRLWSWTEPGWSEWFLGDIDDLGNDRVLITQAPGAIVEVDRITGGVASRMELRVDGDTYRAERYDGCAFFTSVKDCADLAVRYEEVRTLLGGAR